MGALDKLRLDGRVAVITGGGGGIGLACAEALADAGARLVVLDSNEQHAEAGVSELANGGATDEQWRRVIDINLNGVFWSCRAFGRAMLARGRGAIVNIGSMSGEIVNRPQEQASYNASKAAVHHLTKSLAAEWARRGVRVNAVAPTYIDTPMTR